ncbi:MAG TPA: carbohydrate ABC transporter permease, partial [Spirochaetia bacterium]|nr:carbohydrate ABC transporter permease [Spirochaetia bacterium]
MHRKRRRIGRPVVIALIIFWSIFPVYWALNTSLMGNSDAQSKPAKFLPIPVDTSNYHFVFSAGEITYNGQKQIGGWSGFSQSMFNTSIECLIATLVTVIIAIFGAYAFVRMEFRFKNIIFYVTIATLSLPAYATLIPLYRIMSVFHLVDTYTGVILVYVSGFLPLALWILYNYFTTIPKELDEAAYVDGATPLKTMFYIMLPLAGPGIASAAIIAFLQAWGQFLFPLVLTSGIETEP